MAKFRVFIKYWLPPLLWMMVIFSASADAHSYQHSSRIIEPLLRWLFPHMPEMRIGQIHEVLRKCAHLTEYAVFGCLLWRALGGVQNQNAAAPTSSRRRGIIVLLIVAAYASTDEFHQRFVPTRTPHVTDVFIDTAGAALGLACLWIFGKLRRRCMARMAGASEN